MSSSDTAQELEKLRAEVAALRAAKEDTGAEPAKTEAAPDPAPEEPEAKESADHVKKQLTELADLLEMEIRDLPTITCLAVFTAGILLGRFLR